MRKPTQRKPTLAVIQIATGAKVPPGSYPPEANAGTQLAAPNEIGAKAAQAKALMEVSHAALRTA